LTIKLNIVKTLSPFRVSHNSYKLRFNCYFFQR